MKPTRTSHRLRRLALVAALAVGSATGGCASSRHGGDPVEDFNRGLGVAVGVALIGGMVYLGLTADDCDHPRSHHCRCGRR